jgi:hypothetical protein
LRFAYRPEAPACDRMLGRALLGRASGRYPAGRYRPGIGPLLGVPSPTPCGLRRPGGHLHSELRACHRAGAVWHRRPGHDTNRFGFRCLLCPSMNLWWGPIDSAPSVRVIVCLSVGRSDHQDRALAPGLSQWDRTWNWRARAGGVFWSVRPGPGSVQRPGRAGLAMDCVRSPAGRRPAPPGPPPRVPRPSLSVRVTSLSGCHGTTCTSCLSVTAGLCLLVYASVSDSDG